jgi:hypothetical protein
MRGTTGQALLGFCVVAFSQGVLGSGSFSLPLEKKVVAGAKLPSTHRRPAAVVASTPEIDDQVITDVLYQYGSELTTDEGILVCKFHCWSQERSCDSD